MCPLKVKYEGRDVAFLSITHVLKTALLPWNSSQITPWEKKRRIEGGGNSNTEESRPSISIGKKITEERLNGLDCEWMYCL